MIRWFDFRRSSLRFIFEFTDDHPLPTNRRSFLLLFLPTIRRSFDIFLPTIRRSWIWFFWLNVGRPWPHDYLKKKSTHEVGLRVLTLTLCSHPTPRPLQITKSEKSQILGDGGVKCTRGEQNEEIYRGGEQNGCFHFICYERCPYMIYRGNPFQFYDRNPF